MLNADGPIKPPRLRRARPLIGLALLVAACATPLQRLAQDHTATDVLSSYARAAADAGLSIPFPVRPCDEHRAQWTAFDPVRVCVDTFAFDEATPEQRAQLRALSADDADARALGTAVFARILPVAVLSAAVVNRRLPGAPRPVRDAWAHALTRAYLAKDGVIDGGRAALRADLQARATRSGLPHALQDALHTAIEALADTAGDDVRGLITPLPQDFAAWASALQKQSEAQPKRPVRKPATKPAGKLNAKRSAPAADAGPAVVESSDGEGDAGVVDSAEAADSGPAQPADPRAALIQQLVGVWAASTAEANIEYVICADGTGLIRSPDWPRVFKQRWEIKTVDPLVLSLTTVEVEKTATVEVTHLGGDAMTWSVDGETVEFTRKSARASCDG